VKTVAGTMTRIGGFLATRAVLLAIALLSAALPGAGAAEDPRRFVAPDEAGRLVYEQDDRGNRIPDFSHCGYMGGGVAIPDVPVRVVVAPAVGDDGPRIQAAIDHVAALPADGRGIRGAVLLLAGRHEVAGSLRIATGGVVLRGQGDGPGGTVLVASGTDRRTLIRVSGKDDRRPVSEAPLAIADAYVPVGARHLRLKGTEGLHVGDAVLVEHPSTAAWIASLGMDRFAPGEKGSYLNWQVGKMDVRFDRRIAAIEGDAVTLDAPLTTAIDASLVAGTVSPYSWPGRIEQVGVENLRCETETDPANPRDEQHSWVAIDFDAVRDAWVRQVTAVHFAGSAVSIWEGASRVTVEDCASLEPVSEDGGYRRHTFYTAGQMTLFQRCRSERGRHDFAVGYLAAGPNVFSECEATAASGFSGPIESWATGVLYDSITMDGGGLSLTNREIAGQGVGWAAANSVLWQCTAPVITNRKPPGAQNWAIGCWGQFVGDGRWRSPNEFVKPDSLFRGQVADRLGREAVAALDRRTIPSDPGDAPAIDAVVPQLASSVAHEAPSPRKALSVRNGWIAYDDALMVGGRVGTVWWRGHVLPSRAASFGIGVTRFVPGRDGPGFTDDLDQLTDSLREQGAAALEHHYGLWYDRRRDDHQMIRRIDGEVWPPFYEGPWARSGQGTAWDGLSRYDLTKFNPWYFGRLRQFADLCDHKGLALIHDAYFQHNILEAGAHWADFAWRPANCLQETGFPEPPPYAGKKRIFMAKEFYDVAHPERRRLHRLYIRKCLDTLGDLSNVIYLTGEEFTGPLHFVQFWLDTVTEWERETGKDVLIGLSCTKDVQDAILADPARGPAVSVIDLKYWWYAPDGSLYAPPGDQDLAPRQQLREWRGKKGRSDDQTARQVREYRDCYPDKAILVADGGANGWAVLAAGGSMPKLPPQSDRRVLAAVPRMKPFEPAGLTAKQWALAEPGRNYLVYSSGGGSVRLDLSGDPETFTARWIDPKDGRVFGPSKSVRGGATVDLPVTQWAPMVMWLSRE
jgi:hypothetical protein